MATGPNIPICSVCKKPVGRFVTGKNFRRGGQLFYESSCHGEMDRVEYWPVDLRQEVFVPEHAFPSERPPPESTRAEPPATDRGLLDIQDELFELPSWKRLARIEHFQISVRLLERNAQELMKVLEFLTTDERSLFFSDVKHRAQLDQVFEEVLRLLHNFVASALTLVDHTRVIHQELYGETETFKEYQPEIERRFVTDPLIQFVQKLRHLAQHVRLPDLSFELSANRATGMTRLLVLRKDDLLLFSGWNAAAKKYLDAAADKIDVKALVTSYTEAIRAFYKWMDEKQRLIHAADIEEVEAKQAEARSVLAGQIPGLLASGLDIWAQGIGSLQSIFAPALSPADWVLLSSFEGDLSVWTAEAIKIVESKFSRLPEELVLRINQAAANGGAGPVPKRFGRNKERGSSAKQASSGARAQKQKSARRKTRKRRSAKR